MTTMQNRKYVMGKLVADPKPRSEPKRKRPEKIIPIPLYDVEQLTDPECREIMRFQDLKHGD